MGCFTIPMAGVCEELHGTRDPPAWIMLKADMWVKANPRVIWDWIIALARGFIDELSTFMYTLDTEKARAIMFLGKQGVVKELLYPEFEALLDGFVPMEEWANRSVHAVYLEVNKDFHVCAAVFFLIGFDKTGAIEASWNLPLADLARTSHRGPNMGAGPIHLACASHCPVALFKESLWDPDLNASSKQIADIKAALKRNRMGIVFKTTEKKEETGGFSSKEAEALEKRLSQTLSKQYEQELRNQIEQLLKEQHTRISAMDSEKDSALKELRLDYAKKLEYLQENLEDKSNLIEDLEKRNDELKQTIDGQVQKIEGLREYYEHKLQRASGSSEDSSEDLRAHYEAQTESQIASATRELKELLKMKEVELSYRAEHEQHLSQEMSRLRAANEDLLANSGNHILDKLSRAGVNFVTYQPGAGHITIPVSEMAGFLDNPVGFTAEFCGVSEKHYQAWLKHYQAPVCGATVDSGDMCCADVERINSPAEFIPGESDYCAEHNRLARANLKVVKS